MMDDRNLKTEFDGYFEGANLPEGITADAKAQVKKRKQRGWTLFWRIAPVTLGAVLIISGVTMFMNTLPAAPGGNSSSADSSPGASAPNTPGNDDGDSNSGSDTESGDSWGNSDNSSGEADEGSAGGDSDANPAPESPDTDDNAGSAGGDFEGDLEKSELYTDSDITISDQDCFLLASLHYSLKFIEDWASADNASVETCTAAYMDDVLMFVKADVALAYEQTTVYVEFAEDLIYDELAGYYDGYINYYSGARYYLTKTADDGFKMVILDRGIKYYFEIHSSDENAYEKYLETVVK